MSHRQCICAECEGNREDANRYRWLKQFWITGMHLDKDRDPTGKRWAFDFHPDVLDECIDRELAAKPKGNE